MYFNAAFDCHLPVVLSSNILHFVLSGEIRISHKHFEEAFRKVKSSVSKKVRITSIM